jgi:predicted ester cyclase
MIMGQVRELEERATTSENEVAVSKFWGPFWSKGDQSIAEEIFDPDFRDLDPQWPSGAEGKIAAMKEKNSFYFGVVPDWSFTVLKQLVVGDHVVCDWEGTGSHQGEFAALAPTGNSFRLEGISIFTCRNGKIVEQIISYDLLGMLQKMGATAIPS